MARRVGPTPNLLRFVLFVAALVALILGYSSGASAWTQSKFIIGTVDGPCLPTSSGATSGSGFETNVERIATLHGLSVDVGVPAPGLSSPYWRYFDHTYQLTAFAAGGMKTWVPTGFHQGWWSDGFDDTQANLMIDTLQAFSSPLRDAQLGYLVADEPVDSDEDYVKSWIALIHEEDPSKLGYFAVGGIGPNEGAENYGNFLDQWFNDEDELKRPDVIGYCHYPFLHETDCYGPNGVREEYFLNFDVAKDKAGARPIWNYIATQAFEYKTKTDCEDTTDVFLIAPDPTPEQLRFQIYCPLAYGVKGIFYWNYIQRSHVTTGVGIIEECDDTDSDWKFDEVNENNLYIENLVGPMIMSYAHLGAFHQSVNPTGETFPSERMINSSTPIVATSNNQHALVGVFASVNDSALLVVNKNFYEESAAHYLYLRGDRTGRVLMAPSAEDYDGSMLWELMTTTYVPQLGRTRITVPIMPGGQGRLFKVTPPPLQHSVSCEIITLSWSNPSTVGPGWGAPVSFEIRRATEPLIAENFAAGELVDDGLLVNLPNTEIEVEGAECTPRHYAIRFWDQSGHASAVCGSTPLIPAQGACSCEGPAREQVIVPSPTELELSAFSNPTSRPMTIRFTIPADLDGSNLEVSTFDAAGRLVRTLWDGPAKVGTHNVTWDLLDDSKNRTRPGVYFIRLTTAGRTLTRSVATVP